jgi:hypothetical protein
VVSKDGLLRDELDDDFLNNVMLVLDSITDTSDETSDNLVHKILVNCSMLSNMSVPVDIPAAGKSIGISQVKQLISQAQSHLVLAYVHHYRFHTEDSVSHSKYCLSITRDLKQMAAAPRDVCLAMEGWDSVMLLIAQTRQLAKAQRMIIIETMIGKSVDPKTIHAYSSNPAASCETINGAAAPVSTQVQKMRQKVLFHAQSEMAIAHLTNNIRLKGYACLALFLALLAQVSHDHVNEAIAFAEMCPDLCQACIRKVPLVVWLRAGQACRARAT